MTHALRLGARAHVILTCVTALATSIVGQAADAPKLSKTNIKQVVAAMTLEEKAGLVVGDGWASMMATPNPDPIPGTQIGATQVLVPGAAGTTMPIPRLGINATVLADGPAGLRISPTRPGDPSTYYCTHFPVATLLASTWDTDLVAKVGQAMGNEVLEYGVDVLLGPGMNIHRNPLCGRNFEYFSEDPLVSGKIAAAMVKGIESQGVGTSIKHFAANNSETNRNTVDTFVSDRALREIYLETFRIAVQEAQPKTVMSSYNLIDGTYTSESHDLLTKVLRDDWNFKGYVMTDWGGGKDPIAQMKAGNDLLMPGHPDMRTAIAKAVKEGQLDIKVLDRNVERILEGVVEGPRFKGYKFSNKPDLKAHAAVTRQAASDGMVLLKNSQNALPLGKGIKTIATFGNTSYDIIAGGTGSGDVNRAYTVSLTEGLQNAGLTVNADLQSVYANYIKLVKAGRTGQRSWYEGALPVAEFEVTQDVANSMANLADTALITIGRISGEGNDRKNVEGDFQLSQIERSMIKLVCSAFQAKGKKVIVVLNVGGTIETTNWRDMPDAILLAWQGGQEIGNSIADVLTGKVNPSGKLATTFVTKYEDVPSSKTFPGKELPRNNRSRDGYHMGRPAQITYEDGIYVGYRYYDTFNMATAYEFGYGLSYTNFGYSNLKLSSRKFSEKMTVTVDIKNTGAVAGKEVVQLYLTAPYVSLDKPAKELKGFAKTKLLAPGETQTLTFTLDGRNLASFDPAVSAWVADAGQYEVRIGASSRDIRANAAFTLGGKLTVKKESVALVPKEKIAELKAPAR